jgi:hypothetical protein
MVRTARLPFHLAAMGLVPSFLRTLNPCHTDLWQSGWFSPIITINFNISLLHLPMRMSKLTLILGCHSACFMVQSLGCLELFSNSYLSVFGLPPDYHENQLIWVDSSLIVPLGFSLAVFFYSLTSKLTAQLTIFVHYNVCTVYFHCAYLQIKHNHSEILLILGYICPIVS